MRMLQWLFSCRSGGKKKMKTTNILGRGDSAQSLAGISGGEPLAGGARDLTEVPSQDLLKELSRRMGATGEEYTESPSKDTDSRPQTASTERAAASVPNLVITLDVQAGRRVASTNGSPTSTLQLQPTTLPNNKLETAGASKWIAIASAAGASGRTAIKTAYGAKNIVNTGFGALQVTGGLGLQGIEAAGGILICGAQSLLTGACCTARAAGCSAAGSLGATLLRVSGQQLHVQPHLSSNATIAGVSTPPPSRSALESIAPGTGSVGHAAAVDALRSFAVDSLDDDDEWDDEFHAEDPPAPRLAAAGAAWQANQRRDAQRSVRRRAAMRIIQNRRYGRLLPIHTANVSGVAHASDESSDMDVGSAASMGLTVLQQCLVARQAKAGSQPRRSAAASVPEEISSSEVDIDGMSAISMTVPLRHQAAAESQACSQPEGTVAAAVLEDIESSDCDIDSSPSISLTVPQRQLAAAETQIGSQPERLEVAADPAEDADSSDCDVESLLAISLTVPRRHQSGAQVHSPSQPERSATGAVPEEIDSSDCDVDSLPSISLTVPQRHHAAAKTHFGSQPDHSAAAAGPAEDANSSDCDMDGLPAISLTVPSRHQAMAQAQADSQAERSAAAAVPGDIDSSDCDIEPLLAISLTVPRRHQSVAQVHSASQPERSATEAVPEEIDSSGCDVDSLSAISLTVPRRHQALSQAHGGSQPEGAAAAAEPEEADSSDCELDNLPAISLTVAPRRIAKAEAEKGTPSKRCVSKAAADADSSDADSPPKSSCARPAQSSFKIPAYWPARERCGSFSEPRVPAYSCAMEIITQAGLTLC